MAGRKKPSTLLVADDDTVVLKLISFNFDQAGLYCEIFESGDQLLEVVNEDTQACVLDLNMPGTGGLDCLKLIKKRFPHLEVVILTNVNQAAEAVEAVRSGAFDYLTKPFDPAWLVKTVRKAMQLSRKQRENLDLRHSLEEPKRAMNVLGESSAMKHLNQLISRVGPSENAVLLTGESGTGKTLLARALHAHSGRANGPFVSVSCPSLPGDLLESEMFGHEKGAFSGAVRRRLGRAELAAGGTLFLDEIGEIPLNLQTKLLTFLQDKSFFRLGGEKTVRSDVRIIAATNQDLPLMVKEGRFREDLFFRLNVLPLHVPPLRDRSSDIPMLADHFLTRCAERESGPLPGMGPEVYALLQGHDWPGNIRELENSVSRAYTLRKSSETICPDDFHIGPAARLGGAAATALEVSSKQLPLAGRKLSEIEADAIKQTIRSCGGNKSEAARSLGIAEKSIYNKIKKYGIQL